MRIYNSSEEHVKTISDRYAEVFFLKEENPKYKRLTINERIECEIYLLNLSKYELDYIDLNLPCELVKIQTKHNWYYVLMFSDKKEVRIDLDTPNLAGVKTIKRVY